MKIFPRLIAFSRQVKAVGKFNQRCISTTFPSQRKVYLYESEDIGMQQTQNQPEIVFVTGNKGKLQEFTQILGEHFPFKITNEDVDLPEYQGEPDQVSRLKCQSAFEIIKRPVIVEDTSLCFNALGGLPGPYIKCFLKKVGSEGLFKLLHGFDDHSAVAVASIAYCDGNINKIKIFKGMTTGRIVSRGSQGFGWNVWPFLPDGCDKTYAEMSADEKNEISHRKRAVEAMRKYFFESKSSRIIAS